MSRIIAQHSTAQHSTVHRCLSWLKRLIKKIFWVDVRFQMFGVSVFGRNIFVYRNYIIMSFKTEGWNALPLPAENVSFRKITPENINDFNGNGFWFPTINHNLSKYSGLCEFFGLYAEDGQPAGHIGIMYKGGRDIEIYNVKNIDALIIDVCIREEYRRRGFCTYMIREILKYLHTEKHITETQLIVRWRNKSARLAYKRAGGSELYQSRTFSFYKILFPLHGVDL